MSWTAFGRFGGLQFGSGPGSKIPPVASRFGRGGHEITTPVHLGTDLQATSGHATGQVAICCHLRHRTGIVGCRTLQSGRRRPGSRAQDRHLFVEITWFRLLGLIVGLLGTFHAGSGNNPARL